MAMFNSYVKLPEGTRGDHDSTVKGTWPWPTTMWIWQSKTFGRCRCNNGHLAWSKQKKRCLVLLGHQMGHLIVNHHQYYICHYYPMIIPLLSHDSMNVYYPMTINIKHPINVIWLVVSTILKNMSSSMVRMTSHILWKIKHVWNHQPVNSIW